MSVRPTPRTSATAWYRLGNRYLQRQQPEQAGDCFRQALALEPLMGPAWHNLGLACQRLERSEEALLCYRRALQCCPDDPCTLNNLGVLQRELGDTEGSLQTFERLLAIAPEDGDGHWNRALSLLTAERYREGWREYEWRFRRTRPVPIFDPGTPRWQGEPLEGRTILLCCEQGYGDNIQFIRFATLLADWGGTVLLRCPDRSLAGLLAQAPGISATVTPEMPLPPHDCWSPLLSLPYRLDEAAKAIPPCPYLFPDQPQTGDPAEETRIKVGLVWSGRSTDPRRSCPAAALTPLASLRDRITFYSLQLSPQPDELALLEETLAIRDLTPLLTDFGDTARIMAQLDLVISIDTAAAHLAGALGCDCWLLASSAPDWRWGARGERTPWYPTIRIFRQDRHHGWAPAVAQLTHALTERLTGTVAAQPSRLDTFEQLLALADLRRQQEQWSSSLHIYRIAMKRFPEEALPPLCAGGCLLFLNRPAEAIPLFHQALRLAPEMADAHINLGLALLCRGNLATGLREFEWRRTAISAALPPIPELPDLSPETNLSGKCVLLHSEQGFGDLLQFLRYLPYLAATGARIVISVPQPMVRLAASIEGISQVIPHGQLLPNADYQLPLLSLALRLLARLPEIPAPSSYLTAVPQLHDRWRTRLATDGRLRIGLIWRGSDLGKSGYRRSLTAELLAPLTCLPGSVCYSLQLDASADELARLPDVIDLAPEIEDFAETAAIMANLDLIISVDTATAHLAGALGIRCWVPLLFSPDWRWHPLEHQASSWYPSLVPFRQPTPGNWQAVLQAMETALRGEILLLNGHRLGNEGKQEEAIACFRQAAALPGPSAPALLNLGIYLRATGRTDEAREALRQAVAASPDYPEAWQNLGLTHQELGDLAEAHGCLKRALALRPDYPTARWNLGLLQLLLGEYGEGFRNFEHRFDKIGPVARLHTDIPLWDGSSLAGRRILIHAEQGYGDTIQFVRFIPLLADQGAEVVLEVQDRSLLDLCLSIAGARQVIMRGEALPPVDYHCPLLSIPHLLGIVLATVPHKVPYLAADKQKIAIWQDRLPQDGRRKVGICWKGRPIPDPRRSIPFEQLTQLFELPDICWVSLQLDRDETAIPPKTMIDLTGRIADFGDTAALVSCLDLVISIDSAVAHLTGALGVPGIVMLPFAPDWRWTHDQEQTPWYPTLRLVRQGRPNDWQAARENVLSFMGRTTGATKRG